MQSFLLACGFLLKNICLKKIYYVEKFDGALLRLEKNFKILLQINSSNFSKMVLHNSRNETRAFYEPDNLDVNIVCFDK